MPTSPLLAGAPLAFLDIRSGLSALALQHVHLQTRVTLLYHDAPGPAATLPLLAAVATSLHLHTAAGEPLTLVETSMPEHTAESFVYAHAGLRRCGLDDRVEVTSLRVLSADRVARVCGITAGELRRIEHFVSAIHRPRGCAFPGFTETRLDTSEHAAGVAAA